MADEIELKNVIGDGLVTNPTSPAEGQAYDIEVDFDAPGAASPGDDIDEGAASKAARADHQHSLPAFGATAGTFCEGNDSRLSDSRAPIDHASDHYEGGGDEVDVTQLGGYPGNTAQFLRADGSFQSPGIGGYQIWFPDAPPASAHPCDDEMDSESIDAKWTEVDPAAVVTWDVDITKHMYRAVQTSDGTVKISLQRQAVPGSEFVAYTKCDIITRQGANCGIGLFVGDDLATNPTTADFRVLELVHASGSPFRYVLARTWSAYNGSATAVSSNMPLGHYLRVRVNGTTMECDVSQDGVGWYQFSSVTLSFTPAYFGLYFLSVDGGQATGLFSFFRVEHGSGTSGYNATSIGRYV